MTMSKVIIFGGNFRNKGAEALTYSLINLLKVKHPDAEPVLLDLFPSKYGDAKNDYPFTIVNMHVRTLLRLQFGWLKLLSRPTAKSDSEKVIRHLFAEAVAFYDISGYGISSHNQQLIWTLSTIYPVFWADKRSMPVYLMPQSLGPFNYNGLKSLILRPLISRYLSIPEVIFVREPICRLYVSEFRTANVVDSPDIVLLDPETSATEIVANKTIAIIPNMQLTRFADYERVVQLFATLAEMSVKHGFGVCLMAHATGDLGLCSDIFAKLGNRPEVTLHDRDLSVAETKEILAGVAGVVTARYHGAVHALKAGKPVFVFGWAEKYKALMSLFDLGEDIFDISQNADKLEVVPNRFGRWLGCGLKRSEHIKAKLHELISKTDILKYI